MEIIIFIIAGLFLLGVIMGVHEFGHFYFAKKAGVYCSEFSIGMGPKLFQWQRGETTYSIRILLFGAYVMLAGEDYNDDNVPADRLMESKTILERFKIIVFGPVANFLLTMALMFLIYPFVGTPNDIEEEAKLGQINYEYTESFLEEDDVITHVNGYEVKSWEEFQGRMAADESDGYDLSTDITIKDESGNVETHTINYTYAFNTIQVLGDANDITRALVKKGPGKDGLEEGAVITGLAKADDEFTTINNWAEAAEFFKGNEEENIKIKFNDKDGVEQTTEVKAYLEETLSEFDAVPVSAQIGVSIKHHYSFFSHIVSGPVGLVKTFNMAYKNIKLLFANDQVGVSDMSGPVGIIDVAGKSLENGIVDYIALIALLSTFIGFMNLIPIPALDGGRILFLFFEKIGKPVPKKTQETLITVTMLLFFALFIYVMFNDIARISI